MIVEPGVTVKTRRRAPAQKATKKRMAKKAKTVVKKTKRGSRAKMKKGVLPTLNDPDGPQIHLVLRCPHSIRCRN